MMIAEVLAFLFFIGLYLIEASQTLFMLDIVWAFFIGRHFTIYVELMKEENLTKG